MSNLTKDMVQRRLETVASGSFQPEIPGLPGLVFIKMTLKERGYSSRAYSSKLKECMATGDYFSEAMIPSVLEKACRDNGMDPGVIAKQKEILKRFYKSAPQDLVDPIDELTDEEVSELSPEEKAERTGAIEERGRRIMEFMTGFYTEEDQRILEQARQIEDLEISIKNNTAEHQARKHQMETEILLCARRIDDISQPYFPSIEEMLALEDTNRNGLVQLYLKWKQFKEGLLPQFFRPDNSDLH